MPITLTRIRELKIASFTLKARITQVTTRAIEKLFTPSSPAQFQSCEITMLEANDPAIKSLRHILEFPISFPATPKGGLFRKTWDWITDKIQASFYNTEETHVDIECDDKEEHFGNAYAIISLGKFTKIGLKNAKFNQAQLNCIIKSLNANEHIQALELPQNSDTHITTKQNQKISKILARNQGKASLSHWYTNPIKHLPMLATVSASMGCVLLGGISLPIVVNLMFALYTLGNYLDNRRETEFLAGYQKLHSHKHESKPTEAEKTAAQYGEEAGKGWLPYAKICLRHPFATARHPSAFLTGVGLSAATEKASILKPL